MPGMLVMHLIVKKGSSTKIQVLKISSVGDYTSLFLCRRDFFLADNMLQLQWICEGGLEAYRDVGFSI